MTLLIFYESFICLSFLKENFVQHILFRKNMTFIISHTLKSELKRMIVTINERWELETGWDGVGRI